MELSADLPRYSMIYFSIVSITIGLIQATSASEDCQGCRVESVTPNGTQVPTTCRKYASDCSDLFSDEAYPHVLQEVSVILTPEGKGFSITWSTELMSGAPRRQAAFGLERIFGNRNECFAVSANVSYFQFREVPVKLWYNLSCNENINDTNYSLEIYSLPNLFRTSEMYSFHGDVLIARNKDGWSPSILLRKLQKTCDTSVDLLVNFTLPITTRYDSYEVTLCPGSDCEERKREDMNKEVTGSSAIFSGVDRKEYGLWLSGKDKDTAARGLKYAMKGNERLWNPDIQARSNCSTSGSVCNVTIGFDIPEPDFSYSNYTVCLQNESVSDLRCDRIISPRYLETALSTVFIEVSEGVYTLNVTSHGNCPLWETTINRKVHVMNTPTSFPTTHSSGPTKSAKSVQPIDGGAYDATIIVVVSLVCLIAIFIGLASLIRSRKHIKSKALKVDEFGTRKSSNSDLSSGLTEGTDASFAGPLFGGAKTPEVLLLYASDHDVHVTAVKALAEVLSIYGGCHVECDQFCRPDVVYKHNWLKEQVTNASAIIIVDSPGASLIHEAFLSDQMYRKYERDFPTHYHLSATLVLAEEQPQVRKKLARVVTGYSSKTSSLTSLGIQGFCIPENLQELIYFIYGATQMTSDWPCRPICLRSEQYMRLIRHLSAMTELMQRNPNHFVSTYGPSETRLDSGFHPSTYQQWLGGSMAASSGGTFVFTIPECGSQNPDDEWNAEPTGLQKLPLQGLSTAIPNAEEMWRWFANSDSINDNLVSYEGFNQMLQRLNSVPYNSISSNFAHVSTDHEIATDVVFTGCNVLPSKDCEVSIDTDSASCKTVDGEEI